MCHRVRAPAHRGTPVRMVLARSSLGANTAIGYERRALRTEEVTLSHWNGLVRWMYGDARPDSGFWYSHPLYEIRGLDERQLFWVPDESSLCILWHAAHIAHRERTHIAGIIQGMEGELIPPQYEIFGTN